MVCVCVMTSRWFKTHLALRLTLFLPCSIKVASLRSSSRRSLFLTVTEARSVHPNEAKASCLARSACEQNKERERVCVCVCV